MTTITPKMLKDLRSYVDGLRESGAMDGWAYAEIVTPAVVLALLDRIEELEAKNAAVAHAVESTVVAAFGGPTG